MFVNCFLKKKKTFFIHGAIFLIRLAFTDAVWYTETDMRLFDLQPYAGKRVCVAISGGRDSVALLHYFKCHAKERGIELLALTCEHGLRGEASRADLAFVEQLCCSWGIRLYIFRTDVARLAAERGEGTEEAGRKWRYACFDEILAKGAADVVVTAHHRGDYAETVLFRLARGTSLAGLNAFPKRKGIARPFLKVTRAEIDAYIEENALPFVEDESNADERYTRNRLRHSVLPVLEEAVPGAAEHLVAFAERAAADEDYLASLARQYVTVSEGEAHVPVNLPMPLFLRAGLYAMKACGVTEDYTSVNLREISALQHMQSGRRIALPKGLCAVREQGEIVFCFPADVSEKTLPFAPGDYASAGIALVAGEGSRRNALAVDLDAFPPDCVVRTRREGDVFTPFGGSLKPLKKFLTGRKIPARLGHCLPVVARGNVVYAVCGAEISDAVKITEKTVRRGYLFTPLRTPDMLYKGDKNMHPDCERILISEEELAAKVKEAGRWLTEKFRGKNPVAVCNLKGSSVFFSDLVRATEVDLEMDFMAVSSYGAETISAGRPKITRHLFSSVEGKDVILVEDIVDTGRTLITLRNFFKERGAKSVTVVALLDKPSRRVVESRADYTCFEVGDYFIVGYGLDYAERYRNLPYIAVLKESVYEK